MEKLAVFFPGIGYHCDKPLLYYSKKLAAACGYGIREVPYGGFESGIKGNPEKMEAAFRLALAQAEELLGDVEWKEFEELLFVSKSVGTVVAAAFEEKYGLKAKNIFFTPVEQTFLFVRQPGIVFHGNADPWVSTAMVRRACEEMQLPLFLTEGANHSLETGDVQADLCILQGAMERCRLYMEA